MAKSELSKKFNALVAISDLGTQLFWLNKTSKKFEYALPVVAGAEFGGDTETLEAPESDAPKVAKISGRTTLDDVTYSANYTKDRYARLAGGKININGTRTEVEPILDLVNPQTYMEVFSDGSAMVFNGTAGIPDIQSGDIRPVEITIAPQNEIWVYDIYDLTAEEIAGLSPIMYEGFDTEVQEGDEIPVDLDTIPVGRVGYAEENASTEDEEEEDQQGE